MLKKRNVICLVMIGIFQMKLTLFLLVAVCLTGAFGIGAIGEYETEDLSNLPPEKIGK